jgi:redox-sensing transcriptional repressor
MRTPISKKSIYRLSIYLRCLEQMGQRGVATVSSRTLAAEAGVKPTQLRKDLAVLGPLGTRGLGYDVVRLRDKIAEVLHRKELQPVVLVGVGNLGAALMAYKGFEKEGFEIVAGFDLETRRQRRKTFRQSVQPLARLESYVRRKRIHMAVVTVPPSAAQDVANRLVGAGITAILNFAPVVLRVPSHVVVSNVNLAIELENLSYFRSLAGE